ncbi:MAG: sugar transferase [Deltaproteobacteria bacterium]|nr:sugar transferase [Deltaproteobacteria bacterium]
MHMIKRILDITLSSLLLILSAPLFLVVSAAIKLTDGGPVLFKQTRIGKGGRPFVLYKFRSMVINADRMKNSLEEHNHHGNCVTFKMKRDPRVTLVGSIIRKLSMDELPQLWNVLRGEMSLVGPRPPLPDEVARYAPTELKRLEVPPGLTCLWQISGRADIPFEKQVELDREYIENQNVLLDLKILIKTIPAVISCKGAY